MSDDTPTGQSAVREAAALFAAAERLMAYAPDPHAAAWEIESLANAAKALHRRHLDDATAYVRDRGLEIAEARGTWDVEHVIHGETLVTLVDEGDDAEADTVEDPTGDAARTFGWPDPGSADTGEESERIARARAAVDATRPPTR